MPAFEILWLGSLLWDEDGKIVGLMKMEAKQISQRETKMFFFGWRREDGGVDEYGGGADFSKRDENDFFREDEELVAVPVCLFNCNI